MIKTSSRSEVEPFHAMDVLAEATKRARQGRPVISMAVGQPSHPAPAAALLAARSKLDDGRLGYTEALGLSSLRQAIAAYYRDQHGLELDWNRVIVTTGSSAAFSLSFLTFFDVGDRVAIARPGYPAYRNILVSLGLVPVEIPVGPETGYTITPDRLERAARQHGRIAGVLLASPANPTGSVTPRGALDDLMRYCEDAGTVFISDEIYHGLTFDGEETSALELGDNAVIINSFSKYYCMTGWRIGWMVVPQEMVRPIERVAQSLYISAPELSQIAAQAALNCRAELDIICDGYRANRDLLREKLPQSGIDIAFPMNGAFYAYVDVSRHTNDSMVFARQMLDAIDVAATPGLDFDPVEGHRMMRFSFAGAHADMAEAMARLKNWLG